MRSLLVYALLLPALAAPSGDSSGEQSKVVAMNRFNFDDHLGRGPWMVKFFAPWCGHCQKMAPEWVKLGHLAVKDNFHVGEVDCTANRALCEAQGIQGYPTVNYFYNGKVVAFAGGKMVAETFVAFAVENMQKDGLVRGKTVGGKTIFHRVFRKLATVLQVYPTSASIYNVYLFLCAIWVNVLVASAYRWLQNPHWHTRSD